MQHKYGVAASVVTAMVLILASCAIEEEEEHFADMHWDDADLVRGGLMYDKWWKINGEAEPTTDFDPLWSTQTTNERTGSTSWRCKECHGWDYIGKDGRYSSGSHYTGFEGVWHARNHDRIEIFDAIKDEGGNHDFSEVLDDHDVIDLTKFIKNGLIDITLYIDENGVAQGDTVNGETLYAENCQTCHGEDGKQITTFDGVGYLANDNPQETLHKIRFGHPGSSPTMPSMVEAGKTAQEAADILSYCQTLPE